jgi:peptidoglycan/xylan/chitin deacetylase (PgdA/CDA1 family)
MGLTKSNFYQKTEVRIDFSFDDGHKLDLRVAEVLNRYDIKAVFYIVLDWIGRDRFLTWEDIKELDKQGHKIGSHTMSHPSDLKLVYDEQLHYEIQNSKDLLENALGHPITSFSYPRGRADERVKRKVIESGYLEARGTGKTGITKIEDKFYLPGTIHIFQREEYGGKPIFDYAKEVIDKVKRDGGYINIWGHGLEIQENDNWEVFERVVEYANKK